jgi:CheY-like chemotaxis protein
MMGGSIGVHSVPGRGTNFTVHLHLPVVAPPNRAVEPRQQLLPLSPQCVLLAEDNPINATLARKLLEKFGCHVEVASNGREAVEMAGARSYDLIFMDCMMPEMTGYEATGAIRERQPAVPIIAMTAHAIKGAREECLRAGMSDYISKPIGIEEVKRVLALWCSHK